MLGTTCRYGLTSVQIPYSANISSTLTTVTNFHRQFTNIPNRVKSKQTNNSHQWQMFGCLISFFSGRNIRLKWPTLYIPRRVVYSSDFNYPTPSTSWPNCIKFDGLASIRHGLSAPVNGSRNFVHQSCLSASMMVFLIGGLRPVTSNVKWN